MFNVQRQAAGHKLLTGIPGSPHRRPVTWSICHGGLPVQLFSGQMLDTNYVFNEILAIILNEVAPDDKDKDTALEALASCRLPSHVRGAASEQSTLYFAHLRPLPFFSYIRLTDATANDEARVNYGLFVKRAIRLNEIPTIQKISQTQYRPWRCVCHFQTLEDFTSGTLISAILHCLYTFAALPWKLQQIFFVSRGFRIGHSSLVQISKYYNTVSRLYSRFSFYGHRWVPQLATSWSSVCRPWGKSHFFGTYSQQLTLYSCSTT